MRNSILLAATALFVAGCSSSGSPGTPTPAPVLGFRLPSVPSATYHVGDTTSATIDSPMGPMQMSESSTVQLNMTFAEDPAGVRVTGEVAAFDVSAEQPMVGRMTAGLDDLEGPLVFTMDGRGVLDVVSVPEASGIAAQLAGFNAMARSVFPRLPNRVAGAGDSWADTVAWSGEESGADVTSTTIYQYTATGDTMVDGRSLLAMSVTAESEIETKAVQQGAEMTISISSSETGTVLWDTERALLYASDMDRTMTGTVEVGGMGIPPMTMEASGPVRVRLADDSGGSP